MKIRTKAGTIDVQVEQAAGKRPEVVLTDDDETETLTIVKFDPGHARQLGRALIVAADEAETRIAGGE